MTEPKWQEANKGFLHFIGQCFVERDRARDAHANDDESSDEWIVLERL